MSGKYLAARNAFGEGSLSWTTDRILAQLVSAAYRFNENDASADDLAGAVGEPTEVVGAAFQDGWATCSMLKFPQIRGDLIVAVVFLRESDGKLIEYHDAVGDFPMTPNGGDLEIEVTKPGIFRL